jgi:hypothetical protein
MSDEEFETHLTPGAPPPLPAERRDGDMPARAPDLVRAPRSQPASFRHSEAYLAGQIARAVARGQRTQ